jgi:hypothetical protein
VPWQIVRRAWRIQLGWLWWPSPSMASPIFFLLHPGTKREGAELVSGMWALHRAFQVRHCHLHGGHGGARVVPTPQTSP